jgi:hypothetical protein
MKTSNQIILIILLAVSYSCSKDKSYEPLDISYQAKLSVNDSTIINDMIYYKDIIGYDTSNYTFLVDSNAVKRLKNYFFSNGGLPFTVNVLGEQIYSGKFFPLYSQTLPYGITIDPYTIGNKLTVKMDYGLSNTENELIDSRNDKRMISVLQKDNKIIKIDLH